MKVYQTAKHHTVVYNNVISQLWKVTTAAITLSFLSIFEVNSRNVVFRLQVI